MQKQLLRALPYVIFYFWCWYDSVVGVPDVREKNDYGWISSRLVASSIQNRLAKKIIFCDITSTRQIFGMC